MTASTPRAPLLDGRQRKYLRGLAHSLEPVVRVGDSGLTDGLIQEVVAALAAHELIKVRLQQPEDKKALAAELADRAGAAACGLVGHTVILYRPHPDESKRKRLPTRRPSPPRASGTGSPAS